MLEIHIKQEKAKSLEESFYIKDSLNLSYKKNTMVLQCDVYFSVIIKDIDPSNFMKHVSWSMWCVPPICKMFWVLC